MKLFRQLSAGSAIFVTSAGATHAAGIPQMDQTWYPNQLFWLAISFGVLYVLVSRRIAPTIHSLLHAREEAINIAIRDAEEAKRTAEATRSHYESEGQGARGKAAEFVARAQAETSAKATEALAKLDNELAQKATRADARIEDAKAKAASALQSATVSLTSTMVEKLLGYAVKEADVAKAVAPLLATKSSQ